jgi:hypothetical protein
MTSIQELTKETSFSWRKLNGICSLLQLWHFVFAMLEKNSDTKFWCQLTSSITLEERKIILLLNTKEMVQSPVHNLPLQIKKPQVKTDRGLIVCISKWKKRLLLRSSSNWNNRDWRVDKLFLIQKTVITKGI